MDNLCIQKINHRKERFKLIRKLGNNVNKYTVLLVYLFYINEWEGHGDFTANSFVNIETIYENMRIYCFFVSKFFKQF